MEKPTCTIDGCDKPLRVKSLGYCAGHYYRHRVGGDMATPIRKTGQRKPCAADGCSKDAKSRSMCNTHYEYWRKHEGQDVVQPKPDANPPICAVSDCTESTRASGYCPKHYQRYRAHGDPEQGVWESFRGDLDGLLHHATIVTEAGCRLWQRYTEDGYGRLWHGGRLDRIHRVVWEKHNGPIPAGMMIDHTCHNRSCCEIAHLRLVTNQQNVQNFATPVRANNKSGYRGVHWHSPSQKWTAQVRANGKTHVAGYFEDAREAGKAAQQLRLELHTHNDLDRIT